MIVCHCHAISDRAIREAAEQSRRSATELSDHCRAGTGCGQRRRTIEAILDTRDRGARNHCPNAPTRS